MNGESSLKSLKRRQLHRMDPGFPRILEDFQGPKHRIQRCAWAWARNNIGFSSLHTAAPMAYASAITPRRRSRPPPKRKVWVFGGQVGLRSGRLLNASSSSGLSAHSTVDIPWESANSWSKRFRTSIKDVSVTKTPILSKFSTSINLYPPSKPWFFFLFDHMPKCNCLVFK